MFASLLLLATPGLAAATEADLAWLAGVLGKGGKRGKGVRFIFC